MQQQGIADAPQQEPTAPATALHTLPAAAQRLLVTDSISPLPLHKVLTLRAALAHCQDAPGG